MLRNDRNISSIFDAAFVDHQHQQKRKGYPKKSNRNMSGLMKSEINMFIVQFMCIWILERSCDLP